MKLQSWPAQARWLLKIASIVVVYFAAAKLGLSLSFADTNVSPVWPPMQLLEAHAWDLSSAACCFPVKRLPKS